MYVSKTSNYNGPNKYDDPELHTKQADKDVQTLFTALNGRIRFGSGTNGQFGENMGGCWVNVLTSGTANAEVGVKHTLGSQPMGYMVMSQNKAGHLYADPLGSVNTVWTSGTSYFKSDTASVTFKIFLLERGGQ